MASQAIMPPEIITEILHHLPTKSLGRFRCVSKSFQSLLSQSTFIKTHKNTLNHKHFILNSNHYSLYSLPLHYHEEQEAVHSPMELCLELDPHVDMFTFHGSCNGLVLLSGHDVDGGHTLIVLNPVTTEFVTLPKSGLDIIDDMREIDIVFGFGYDFTNDDYKVVTISFFEEEVDVDGIHVHVYSLKTCTWKWVCDFPYDHTYGKSFPGVFVNGFLHWIAIRGSDDLGVIVAFSLENENLSEVALPKCFIDVDIMATNEVKLDFGEKLVVFLGCEVWLMNEYGVPESWTKIELNGFNVVSIDQPMIFFENGEILVVVDNQMLVYDIEGRLCGCLDTNDFVVRGICVESLVSPKYN
ncbi:hypothetical protein QVD17_04082 [Tagetes erecta]|uniref:F-box domain-containing protein n=1 Tax=Tagetes erecta TaxID=13708 RepID=A0AAD8LFM9_TARER|nr:hypothetical protein QVD17_04082 [Tagetes erecta]